MTSDIEDRPDARSAIDGRTRPVSPIERQFLAAAPGSAIVLQLCVEGDGSLDPVDLAAAVARAGELCPDSRSAARDGRWVDLGVPPDVVDAGVPPEGGPAELPELRWTPGDDEHPWCEVVLVRHPAGTGTLPTDPTTPLAPTTTVVFRAHHGLMDARGVVLWAQTVFAVLRGEDPAPLRDTLTDVELADRCLAARERPAELPEMGMDWTVPLPRASQRGDGGPVWRRRSIEGVHPGLVARLVAGLAAHTGGPVRGLVPVDLRRHDPALATTANLVLQVILDGEPGQDASALHTRLLTLLSESRELDLRPPASMAEEQDMATAEMMMSGVDAWCAEQGRYTATAIVSHWGRLRRADHSAPGFDARAVYTLPVVPPATPMVIDAVEIEGRTEIAVGWHDGPGVDRATEELLAGLARAVTAGLPGTPDGPEPAAVTDTGVPLPATTVVEDLDAAIAASPDAVALVGEDTTLTYAELDARADIVAASLDRHGVTRGDVVGVIAGRSASAVAAIWGILRVGAAYLPIDPAQPDARVRYVLEDSRAVLCLLERPHEARPLLPDGVVAAVLDDVLDAALHGHTGPVPDGPAVPPSPSDLAYVIYTSGSTGRPKGVQIEHRALANYTRWAVREFGIGPHTRMPWLTSPSFDVSATSLYAPLVAGGAIVLMSTDPTPDTLRALLTDGVATEITCTPSHLELIGRLGVTATGVRCLAVIGEQLRTPVARRAREVFGPDCRVVNEYGPTEATVGVTVHEFDETRDGAAAVVPIGRPMENCTVHLLDDDGRHAAVGEVGRLFLGGTQLARGYLGRPDLNRDRFVRLVSGERVYDTGDLARVLPGGAVEFHGRSDDQIKILGHRIEPAEIAQVAEEHPAISQAVVLPRAPRPGAPDVLVLWARREPGAAVDGAAVEEHLAAALPHYMVPAASIVLDELPQTVNGKVDALALPDPFAAESGTPAPAAGPAGSAPGDEVTTAVAAVWQRILELPPGRPPAPDVDFHRLGGDSLSLLLMIDSVGAEVVGPDGRDEFAGRLGDLVRSPTVRRVADLAREAREASREVAGAQA